VTGALPPTAPSKGLSFLASARRRLGGWSDGGTTPRTANTTPLTAKARALYEGRVVPVRDIAKLCGVSVATLYHHAHKRGWTMRNAAPVKGGARDKDRRRAQRNALVPKSPGGLMSRAVVAPGVSVRDPQQQEAALAQASGAQALADAAHAQAVALRNSEIDVRLLAALAQAFALLRGSRKPRRRRPSSCGRHARLSPRDLSRLDMLAELAHRMNAAVAAWRDG
jgi:AcrR family transcriptional regulator